MLNKILSLFNPSQQLSSVYQVNNPQQILQQYIAQQAHNQQQIHNSQFNQVPYFTFNLPKIKTDYIFLIKSIYPDGAKRVIFVYNTGTHDYDLNNKNTKK